MGNNFCKAFQIHRLQFLNTDNVPNFILPIYRGKVIYISDEGICVISFYQGKPYKFFLKIKNKESKTTIIRKFLFKVVNIKNKEVDAKGILSAEISL
jgi:hypothetical protein